MRLKVKITFMIHEYVTNECFLCVLGKFAVKVYFLES